MNMLNQCILEGKLTEDATTTKLSTGVTVTKFEICIPRYHKGLDGNVTEEKIFLDIEEHGNLHKYLDKLTKDRGVRIVGRLQNSTWDIDGKKITRVYVLAEHVEFKGGN